jgi:hypothetical protein
MTVILASGPYKSGVACYFIYSNFCFLTQPVHP